LDALALVVDVIVLWNTLYMEVAASHLRAASSLVRPEDMARLSPLGHDHINFLGRYFFALAETVIRGELRPFEAKEPSEIP